MSKVSYSLKKLLEFIKELMFIVLMALLFTTFIVSHNKIPSGSMVRTINEGDHVLTSMLPYYYRNPEYGEIVVFKQGTERWVKRVIGKPGDVIDIREGMVFRNGEMLEESQYIGEGTSSEPFAGHSIDFPYTVPEEHYFLMGDNRRISYDCRYLGAISRRCILGKAWMKIYPFSEIGQLK